MDETKADIQINHELCLLKAHSTSKYPVPKLLPRAKLVNMGIERKHKHADQVQDQRCKLL